MRKILLLTSLFIIPFINAVDVYSIYPFQNVNRDVTLTILIYFMSIITTIAGIGGGGILIPLFIILGGFSIEEAIPLTVISILGDTLVRVIYLFNKRHPYCEKRYLMNQVPILLITPFDGNTSFIGVILAKWTPSIIRLICIMVVLSYTFYKTSIKAYTLYKKENKTKSGENVILQIDGIEECIKKKDYKIVTTEGIGDSFNSKVYTTTLMGVTIGLLAMFTILREPFSLCSSTFWLITVIQFSFITFLGMYIVKYVERDYKYKKANQYIFLEGDIVCDKRRIIEFITAGSITGAISTYMGIGGGMLITPIMLQSGMIPEVVVASSSLTTLFSSFISVINYIIYNELYIYYGLYFAFISGIASYTGLKVSEYMLEKFNRQSIIVFIICGIIFLSTFLLVYNTATDDKINDFSFSNICNA